MPIGLGLLAAVVSLSPPPVDSGLSLAVAASGTFLDRQLPGVRRFRDQTLLRSRFGQGLVGWCYGLSPPLARYIAGSETRRTVTRLALVPTVFAVRWPGVALGVVGGVVLLTVGFRRQARTCRRQVRRLRSQFATTCSFSSTVNWKAKSSGEPLTVAF